MSVEDFVIEAKRWRRQGAVAFCASSGTGPEYIAALKEAFGDWRGD